MNALSTNDAPGFVEIRIWETCDEYSHPLCCGMVDNVFTESLPPGAFRSGFLNRLIESSLLRSGNQATMRDTLG